MEGKMSKKFLKVLGICILIIMLPVLITVSAVCLVEDLGPTTYTVYSNHAENVELKNEEGTWKISAVPTRSYYTFTGIEVKGNKYSVVDGVVVLAEDQKEAFEADVEANNPITGVWVCDYSYINVSIWGGENFVGPDFGRGYNDTDLFGEGYDFDLINNDIETYGIFEELAYSKLGIVSIDTFSVYVDLNDDNVPDTEEELVLSFEAEDKTANGDITVRTLLDKLAEKTVTLPKTSNSYAEIFIVG